MTDLRKAAEMALEALMEKGEHHQKVYRAAEALRQALAQPKRKWVGLTDADKQEAFDETQEASGGFWEFADYLEAKLKEKNTGAQK